MTISPNDQDPPDYVTGDTAESTFHSMIFDKFPWIADEYIAMHYNEELYELIQYVMDEAYKKGREDAQSDMGEYIHVLEQEALGAVRMVLDAFNNHGVPDYEYENEVLNAIDRDLLIKIDKKYGRRDAK